VTTPPDPAAGDAGCDCTEALALLQDYLKQELDRETVERIERHFVSCLPCFRSRQFEERFIALIAERTRGICAPEAVRARVLAALDNERASR
jgi:anti-sigma factor (TIGR02949 family)